MKKSLLIAPLVFVLIVCFILPKPKNEIPSFDLLLIDSITHFSTDRIPSGKPIVLLYFSPDCEHCQKLTADIINHMNILNNINFYFITYDPYDRMKTFDYYFGIGRFSNIRIGRDIKYYFPSHFPSVSPPYMAIYDSHKRFRGVYKGEIKTDTLINFLNHL